MTVPLHDAAAARVRTRTMIRIGLGVAAVFLILLVLAVIPRVRGYRALAVAAQGARTTPPGVTVGRPVAATDSGLTLAGPTPAIQQPIIYPPPRRYPRHTHTGNRDTSEAPQRH